MKLTKKRTPSTEWGRGQGEGAGQRFGGRGRGRGLASTSHLPQLL